MQHVVDRQPWAWQDTKATPPLTWLVWVLCALFCLSASVNTGITGLTFGLPFAFVLSTLAFRGYARRASVGLLFLCAILKFAQDDTSTLYYNGIGDDVSIVAAEFCPNTGGSRPYLARQCEKPASPRLKRTLGRIPAGNYPVVRVDAEYGEFSTRYVYVVDTPYGPAQVNPVQSAVVWADGSAVEESRILKDVPRWLSMLMFYPQVPLLILRGAE